MSPSIACRASRPARRLRVEHLLQQFGQRLRALAAQRLAFVAYHRQPQRRHGGDVLDDGESRGLGALTLVCDEKARRAPGRGHREDESAGDRRWSVDGSGQDSGIRYGNAGQEGAALRRAEVDIVSRQAFETAQKCRCVEVLGDQPAQRAEDLELRAQPVPGVLLGRGGDLLGDGDERDGERHFEDREAPLLRRLEERVVQRGHVQLRGERESGYPGVVQPLQIGTLSGRGTGDRQARRHDHLGAQEPGRRIGELAGVRPGHGPVQTAAAGLHGELECREGEQVPDGEFVAGHTKQRTSL